jgi:hypothetical protein
MEDFYEWLRGFVLLFFTYIMIYVKKS